MQPLHSVQDVRQLGTILGVWGHPDDESFLAAGIMAAAAVNGQKVACVTATRGEKGTQDESRWPASELAHIRTAEMHAALQILGINQHWWLDYPDDGCAAANQEDAVRRLAEIINEFKPDTILTFGPEGMTGHPDHAAVSRWSGLAAEQVAKEPRIFHAVILQDVYDSHLKAAHERFNFFFNIDMPPLVPAQNCDVCIDLPRQLVDKKYRALQAMPSQTEGLLKAFPREWFFEAYGYETYVLAS